MYTVNLECKSLVKAFNVETSLTMPLVHNLVAAACKSNYNVATRICFKKKGRPTLSLEELIEQVHKHRFYRTEKILDRVVTEDVIPLKDIIFPMSIRIVRCWSTANANITFFELDTNSNLSCINFDALKDEFEAQGLDLCKSKTEGVWYTHNDIDLHIADETIMEIVKHVQKIDYVSKEVKVEL